MNAHAARASLCVLLWDELLFVRAPKSHCPDASILPWHSRARRARFGVGGPSGGRTPPPGRAHTVVRTAPRVFNTALSLLQGDIPIMLKSRYCNLKGALPALISRPPHNPGFLAVILPGSPRVRALSIRTSG